MSKVVIYILDKIVWLLLISAIAAQSLQIAGVVDAPRSGLGDISYKQDNEYNFQVQVGDSSELRGKREAEQRSPFIDSLFQVPIQTLTAVNNLVQNSRPAFRTIREYAMKKLEKSRADKSNQTESVTNSTSITNGIIKKLYPVFLRPKEEIKDGKE